MAIHRLVLDNFRGIDARTELDIAPLTMIIGPNSSGKSSVVHGMAVLAQTAKISTNQSPIVLDDSQAFVHLGRFIDVIHRKSYIERLTLGVTIKSATIDIPSGGNQDGAQQKISTVTGDINVEAIFFCSKRTQLIGIQTARYEISGNLFEVKKSGKEYRLHDYVNNADYAIPNFKSFIIGGYELAQAQVPFATAWPLVQIGMHLNEELSGTRYLGPFRQAPQRAYETRGAEPTEVGPAGERAMTMLARETVRSKIRPHIKQIATWLAEMGIGKRISVSRVTGSDLFDVSVTLHDGRQFSVADLGYGISQVLPVLTQCSFAPNGSTLLFEQPEIHLHTAAARLLADVFVDVVRKKQCHIVAETHSPQLVYNAIQSIRAGELDLSDFILYRAERIAGATSISRVDVYRDGDYIDVDEDWERGMTNPSEIQG